MKHTCLTLGETQLLFRLTWVTLVLLAFYLPLGGAVAPIPWFHGLPRAPGCHRNLVLSLATSTSSRSRVVTFSFPSVKNCLPIFLRCHWGEELRAKQGVCAEFKAAGKWQDDLGLHKHWDTSWSFYSIAIQVLFTKNICWFQQIHV